MNERIRKLAKKSGFSLDTNNIYTAKLEHLPIAENIEKFAESIVKECAELNFRELGLSGSSSFDVSRMIKQHFGVEE